tara:strand:+ start:23456 stop:25789 length:2334 start_codon:yes stop_codon:yes gene_type:complete
MAKYSANFPPLLLSENEKNEKWCEQMIDAIMTYTNGSDEYKSHKIQDLMHYQIYNGEINRENFKYVTEQYGFAYPARLVNYPIIKPKIDLLVGEDLKRPLDYKVSTVNKEAVVRKEDYKVNLMMNELLKDIKEEIKAEIGHDLDVEDGTEFPVPEDIDLYMRYNYREMIEETAQDGLEYLINHNRLKDVFKNGFRDLLVTAKEFYKVYVKDGDPYVRRVDPRAIIYDQNVDSDFIDDSQWVGEERWMNVNEILDEYRDDLSKDDVAKLTELMSITSHGQLGEWNSFVEWVDWNQASGLRVRVVHCEWKAIKRMRFKVSENKYNPRNPFRKLLPDTYKPRKKDNIEIKYIDDVWEGTKIGGKILVGCQRRVNQVRSVDDVGKTKLSYIGCVKGNVTGRSVSLVHMLKDVQMLYNIVMYHIELTMARSGGKAVVYDVSQMPANLGMDMQSVLYHIKNDGIIPINSKDEGNQAAAFNQFQQVDFTLSNSVQQLINLKLMLEDTAGTISGVTKQREGAVGQYEYVGNVQRAVVQSSVITEDWFFAHNETKKRVFETLCDLMKLAWAGGKKAATILGDGAYKFLNVMPDIALNDYGVYLGDSGKDEAMKGVVSQLAQTALQSGQIDFLNVIKVMKADTMTEAEHVLERGMDEMKKIQEMQAEQAQQQAQAEAEAAMAEKQADAQIKQMELDTQIKIAEMNNETKIHVAEINSDDKRDVEDMKERGRLISEHRATRKDGENLTPELTEEQILKGPTLDESVEGLNKSESQALKQSQSQQVPQQ